MQSIFKFCGKKNYDAHTKDGKNMHDAHIKIIIKNDSKYFLSR